VPIQILDTSSLSDLSVKPTQTSNITKQPKKLLNSQNSSNNNSNSNSNSFISNYWLIIFLFIVIILLLKQ